MIITGYESWTAGEIADMMDGNAIPADAPRETLHGVLLLLARRVEKLEDAEMVECPTCGVRCLCDPAAKG